MMYDIEAMRVHYTEDFCDEYDQWLDEISSGYWLETVHAWLYEVETTGVLPDTCEYAPTQDDWMIF